MRPRQATSARTGPIASGVAPSVSSASAAWPRRGEFIHVVEQTGTCGEGELGQATTRTTRHLESVSTPVQPFTWGALKALYR